MRRHSTFARGFAGAVIVVGVTAFSSFSVTAEAVATSTAFVDVSIPKMNVNRSLCKFNSYGYHYKTSILHRRWMMHIKQIVFTKAFNKLPITFYE
jgi:hypothetical protein